MIGVVNTAVIGQLPDPYYIGAIAVGALIFSFIFWGFGFLRLSTGGLSAQATGAGRLGRTRRRSGAFADDCRRRRRLAHRCSVR